MKGQRCECQPDFGASQVPILGESERECQFVGAVELLMAPVAEEGPNRPVE